MCRGSKKGSGVSPEGCLQPEERTGVHPGKALACSGDRLLSDAEPWREVLLSGLHVLEVSKQLLRLSGERADSRSAPLSGRRVLQAR